MTRKQNPYGNRLRVDLYTRLFPHIIREDNLRGVEGVVNFWDDPLLKWDGKALWNEVGILPVIKNLFFCIEKEEELDLQEIDGLTDLVDSDTCPEQFLDLIAGSLGYTLEDGLSEAGKRETLKSIIEINKSRGKRLSWDVFFRIGGFSVTTVPLWKKTIQESDGQYSRLQYQIASQTETVGTPGTAGYSGTLSNTPIRPGSVRIKVNGKTYRDDGNKLSGSFGQVVSADGATGQINYARGTYELVLPLVATTNVVYEYEQIINEYPYRAARVDLELFYVVSEDGTHAFTEETIRKLLERLEYVRPIHVLVRLIVITLDIEDIVEDFARDEILPVHMAKDVRETEYRFYTADLAEAPMDQELVTYEDDVLDRMKVHLEDQTAVGMNPDWLEIVFSDSTPTQYW